MPRIIETTVYAIDELAGAAREAARDRYRHEALPDAWHDFVHEDFAAVCEILGIALATVPVPLHGGGTREEPQIYFQGFHSQGDGASFAGRYRYARGAARAIRAHAPKDAGLHRIADELQALQRRNLWQLHASIHQSGRHCHEHTMTIEVERCSPTWQPPTDGAEDAVAEAMRDLARWLYARLRAEYEHQTSDEAVDAMAAANAWTFTADGERFG